MFLPAGAVNAKAGGCQRSQRVAAAAAFFFFFPRRTITFDVTCRELRRDRPPSNGVVMTSRTAISRKRSIIPPALKAPHSGKKREKNIYLVRGGGGGVEGVRL